MRTFTEEEVEILLNSRICEKPKTNADRIRSMSDEELAEFIKGLSEHCLAGIGACDCSGVNMQPCYEACGEMARKWLQSEVEV